MCFVCSERHLHLAGFDRLGERSIYKGSIEYHSIGKLMQKVADNKLKWDENLDFQLWKERYGPKVPAATVDSKEPEHGFKADSWEWRRIINCVPYGNAIEAKEAICCPEDIRKHPKKCQHADHILCKHCSVPLCLECWSRFISKTGYKIPAALANDNFQGYSHPFIVRNKVRWIEAVTACPFFSSLVTYYVEGKGKERHHLAGEELGRLERAYAARGNIYSYILPWESILRAAAKVTSVDVFKSWPHPPHVVAHMIRFIFKGTDEEQCLSFLKELRIRSHVLVGLGRIYAEHLHEMFTGSPVAARLLNRAQNFANYEAGVRLHYP